MLAKGITQVKETRRRQWPGKFEQNNEEEAVKLVKEQGYSVTEAAKNLGVSPGVLDRWNGELEKREDGESDPASIVNLQAELKRLWKKNKRLEMEREILKKRPPSSRENRDAGSIY